jgi:dihydrofolate reductase
MNSIPFDIVVGRSLNHGIGLRGQLPWHLPRDLQMFKKITCSGPHVNSVIMGRKTYESIGRALPNRLNIVVSRSGVVKELDNVKQARSLDDALKLAESVHPEGKKFVIGGAKLFEESLGSCRYIY